MMCGRFTITVTYEELTKHLNEAYQIDTFELQTTLPRYNVAPGQDIISIINDGKKNRVGLLKWGFIPTFLNNQKTGLSIINAKAETLSEKVSFKDALKYRRCVVLANSFYEWRTDGKDKIPMRFLFKDQRLFPIAGLFNTTEKDDGTKLHTVTLITTTPNHLVETIHDRMPVILNQKDQALWLDPSITDKETLQSLLKPYPSDVMDMYQVSKKLNSSTYDAVDCIQKVEIEKDLFHF